MHAFNFQRLELPEGINSGFTTTQQTALAGPDRSHFLASDQVSRQLENAEAHHRELCHSFLMLADIGNIWNTRYVFQAGSHRLI